MNIIEENICTLKQLFSDYYNTGKCRLLCYILVLVDSVNFIVFVLYIVFLSINFRVH